MGTGEALRGRIAYAPIRSPDGRIAIERGARRNMTGALRNMAREVRYGARRRDLERTGAHRREGSSL